MSTRVIFWGNVICCILQISTALTTGNVLSFFLGGANGFVALLMWNRR